MEIQDIPAWVPEPVRRAASVYGAGHPLIANLLSTPRMEAVWRYFEGHAIETDFKDRFGRGTGLAIPDLHGVDLHWHNTPNSSQALFFLFFAILVAANNSRNTPNKERIDEEIEKLQNTKTLVDSLRHWAPWPTLTVEPNIDRAIEDIIALCDDRLSLLDYSNSPGVVVIKGDESVVKSCVRSIGATTYALYGECCYGQLATIANAMFAPDEPINSGKTEKWCTRPRLPLMDAENGRGPNK